MAMVDPSSIDLDEVETAVRAVLQDYPEIAVGYVFGSVARGDARPDSDLDVGLVYVHHDPSGSQHVRIAPTIAGEIGRRLGIERVDVVDLEAQGHLFCHQILLDARRTHVADADRRVDFESEAISRGLDFRPTYELATQGKVSAMRRWLREHK